MITILAFKRQRKKVVRYKCCAEGRDFILITAPFKRPSERLIEVLDKSMPVVMPYNAPEALHKFSYPTRGFKNRVLLAAFFEYCKLTRPKSAAIYGCEFIENEYFILISRFTDRLYLCDKPEDTELCREALGYSGTPILFGNNTTNLNTALIINSNKRQTFDLKTAVFCEKAFNKAAANFKNCEFAGITELDPIQLSAALYEQYGLQHELTLWKERILNCDYLQPKKITNKIFT